MMWSPVNRIHAYCHTYYAIVQAKNLDDNISYNMSVSTRISLSEHLHSCEASQLRYLILTMFFF